MDFLRCDNDQLSRALLITRQVAEWFDNYDPGYEGHPNIRVSRTLLAVCIGDECVWNSKDNQDDQLTFTWVMGEYRRVVGERYKPLSRWYKDWTTFTGDQE